jgi:hypothetical protein
VALPAGVAAELVSAFPVETHGSALEIAIGDLAAGDEIDLVFTARVGHGVAGDALPLAISAAWTDPRADARREIDASPAPLRRADPREVSETDVDELVAERTALQRAAAERRAALELDRAGRYRESRARMMAARQVLQAAPMTARVDDFLLESEALAAAPATQAYSSHVRKSAQHADHLRRRGRHGRDRDGDDRRS